MGPPIWEWVGLQLVISPLQVEAECGNPKIAVISQQPAASAVNGVRLRPRTDVLPRSDLLIVARGDQILAKPPGPEDADTARRALDGNHLGPGLNGPNFRCPTGDGVEGGRFESWIIGEGED